VERQVRRLLVIVSDREPSRLLASPCHAS